MKNKEMKRQIKGVEKILTYEKEIQEVGKLFADVLNELPREEIIKLALVYALMECYPGGGIE